MERIKQLVNILKKWKNEHYSIMVIPNAGGSVKQMRIQAICIYAALFLGISAGVFFLTSSLVLIKTNFAMQEINADISDKVSSQESTIDSLSKENAALTDENKDLKDLTASSTKVFNARVDEINALKAQIDTLLVLFNRQNNSDIKVTTSRGSSRTAATDSADAIPTLVSLEDPEEMKALSAQVRQDIALYTQLVAKVEAELKAQDAKPDHWPARGLITSPFGDRSDPLNGSGSYHEAIDIDNSTGAPISAAGAGVVTFCGYRGSYGNVVVISHGFGYETLYAHLASFDVKAGERVKKGQVFAAMGSSGRTTGSHLHFEVHKNGKPINPESVLE